MNCLQCVVRSLKEYLVEYLTCIFFSIFLNGKLFFLLKYLLLLILYIWQRFDIEHRIFLTSNFISCLVLGFLYSLMCSPNAPLFFQTEDINFSIVFTYYSLFCFCFSYNSLGTYVLRCVVTTL